MITQHYVEFYSPGTFVSETTAKPVDAWDVEAAVRMASAVTERYNATPYGFRFTTRGREDDELDSRQIAKSPFYYLGGVVETLAEVKAKGDPSDRILISNMECNGWDRVITNTNSWKVTRPLEADDVILDFTPPEKPSEVAA